MQGRRPRTKPHPDPSNPVQWVQIILPVDHSLAVRYAVAERSAVEVATPFHPPLLNVDWQNIPDA